MNAYISFTWLLIFTMGSFNLEWYSYYLLREGKVSSNFRYSYSINKSIIINSTTSIIIKDEVLIKDLDMNLK